MADEIDVLELDRRLAYIGKSAVGVCRVAVAAGARVLAKAMADKAPMHKGLRKVGGKIILPGGMKRSIGSRSLKAKKGIGGAKAGLNVGAKAKEGSKRSKIQMGNHGHLYIKGTVDRWSGFARIRTKGSEGHLKRTKSKIRFRGRSPAHEPSFIRAATTASEAEVWKVVAKKTAEGIAKAATKQGL